MTFRVRALFLFLVGLLTLSDGLVAQRPDPSAQALLRAAIDKEVVDGDIQGAIEQYRAIASKHAKTDRAVAAAALLHVAECYQKLGDAQAQTVYAQIVRDYADQPEAVATALARIASPAAGTSAGAMTERVVMTTTGFGLRLDRVTPDGRFGVGGDESNGDLIVRDMATGAVTRLLKGTINPRTVGGPGQEGLFVASAVMSPDARHVAFTRYGESESMVQGRLWVIPNQPDGTPRLVTTDAGYDVVEPLAWSLDGRSVFAWVLRTAQPSQLAWISVSDGAVRVIKSAEPGLGFQTSPQLAPDGRHIAYARRTVAGWPDQSIFVLAADGSGNEIELTRTAGVNNSPMWTPDGRHILFVSNRSSTLDLWAVPVRDGSADAPALMLKRNIERINAIGMTRTGSFYYDRDLTGGTSVVGNARSKITVARSVGDSWRDIRKLDTGDGGAPSWSPDGTILGFARVRPGGSGSSQTMFILKNPDSGEERVVAQDQDYAAAPPRWFPDGQSLLVNTGGNTGVLQSYARVDVTGQSAPKLLFTWDRRVHAANNSTLAPDGKTVYFSGTIPKEGKFAAEATYGLLKLDLETQAIEAIVPFPRDSILNLNLHGPRVSPDGRSFAYLTVDKTQIHVMTVSVNGGAPREVFTDLSAAISGGLAWTPDGRGLLIGRRVDANRWQIVRLNLESGALQVTTLPIDERPTFMVSPDGSRIAIFTRTRFSETKVLDNVLSALR